MQYSVLVVSIIFLVSLILFYIQTNVNETHPPASSIPIVRESDEFFQLYSKETFIANNTFNYQKIENDVNECNKTIQENSEALINFMQNNLDNRKQGCCTGQFSFCTTCLLFHRAYSMVDRNNTLIMFWHHNRFQADASFDEDVTCEISSGKAIKFYVNAVVGHAN